MKRKVLISLALVIAVAGCSWWIISDNSPSYGPAIENADVSVDSAEADQEPEADAVRPSAEAESGADSASDDDQSESGAAAAATEEEKAEADAEAKVEAFDNLTDKWMEPAKTEVTMRDIENFSKVFRQVPKARRDECVHRALNLIPDENVMLLAGILMDKSMDKEIVETVFNDVLNRDESVKMPILKQIFQDKTHPCYADTAWILDATGELPEKSK